MADEQGLDVAKRFKEFRKTLGISQQELANVLEITQPYLSAIEAGKHKFSAEMLIFISKTYGLNIHWLLTGEGFMKSTPWSPNDGHLSGENGHLNPQIRQNVMLVPVLAQAGFLGNWTQEWVDQNLVKTSIPGVEGPAFAFEVDGDSMQPTIHPGDYIVGTKVERKEDVRESRVHIVISRTSGIYIKRLYHDNDFLILESDNDRYPPVALPGDDVMAIYYAIKRLTSNFSGPRPYTSRLDRVEDFLANKFPEFKGQEDGDQ